MQPAVSYKKGNFMAETTTDAVGFKDGWAGSVTSSLVDDKEYKKGRQRGTIARYASDENVSFNSLWRKCNEPMITYRHSKKGKKKENMIRVDHLGDMEETIIKIAQTAEKQLWPDLLKNPILDSLIEVTCAIEEARDFITYRATTGETKRPLPKPVRKGKVVKATKKDTPKAIQGSSPSGK